MAIAFLEIHRTQTVHYSIRIFEKDMTAIDLTLNSLLR